MSLDNTDDTMNLDDLLKPIQIYLKTDEEIDRPDDPEFYLMTRNGLFLCRNHKFFQSDVPAPQSPGSLAEHKSRCILKYPKLPKADLEMIVGYFARIFAKHKTEAIVLFYWNLVDKKYELVAPDQEVSGSKFYTSPAEVTYKTPINVPSTWLLVGTIHSHCDFSAYSSSIDKADEKFFDGIHAVVGKVNKEPPEFHIEMSIDGTRFSVELDMFFEGYDQKNDAFPEEWMDKLKIVETKTIKPARYKWQGDHWRKDDDYFGYDDGPYSGGRSRGNYHWRGSSGSFSGGSTSGSGSKKKKKKKEKEYENDTKWLSSSSFSRDETPKAIRIEDKKPPLTHDDAKPIKHDDEEVTD